VLHESAEFLPKAFADADFEFFSRTLAGQQKQPPRWRRCVIETDERLGEALGQGVRRRDFGPKAKADTAADGAGHQERRCARTSTPRRG
jgi:predicted metalloendopeptidase